MPILASTKAVWGLDIAASAIKGVRMRAEADRVQILEADILSFEGEPPSSDSQGRDRRIWQALQRFEAKYNVSSDRVSIGLPGSVFFMRPFSLFLVGERTEAELVRYEMEQHMPFGLDAVLWDYELFDPGDMSIREREGLLFAMKKEVLNNYLLSMATARIDPFHIQTAPLALYNLVRYEFGTEEPVLAVDIGAGSTNLLATDGKRYWLRTINSGGEAMTTAVRNAFRPREVSYEDALAIKTKLAQVSQRGEVIERITPALRAYVGEVRTAIRHFALEHKQTYNKIILYGGASGMYGLQRLLSEELGMRVITPDGLARIDVPEPAKASYVNANLPALGTAIGLGLQGLGRSATRVNMVSATLAQRRTQTLARRAAVIGVSIAAAILVTLGVFATWHRAIYDGGVQKLAAILGPVKARYDMARVARSAGGAESRMNALQKMAEGRGVWLTVLDKVARMLPENDRPGLAAKDKMWLISVKMKARPNEAGVYDVDLEAGSLLRSDGTDYQFAIRTLKTPLERDPRGIFRRVSDVIASRHAPALSFAAGQGTERYYLVRLRFEVVTEKGGGS